MSLRRGPSLSVCSPFCDIPERAKLTWLAEGMDWEGAGWGH